jgi:hypothetical protein
MKRIALFVGIDEYSNGIQPLSCARHDAEEMWSLFRRSLGFVTEKMTNSEASGADVVLRKIREMTSDLGPGDLFLFGFAGHGIEADGRKLLVCSDARLSDCSKWTGGEPPLGTVALDRIAKETAGSYDRAFLLDMCRAPLPSGQRGGRAVFHSGRDLSFEASRSFSTGSFTYFYACDEGQSSMELPAPIRSGLFSAAFSKLVDAHLRERRKVLLNEKFVGEMETEMRHVAETCGLSSDGQRPQRDPHGDDIVLFDHGRDAETTPSTPSFPNPVWSSNPALSSKPASHRFSEFVLWSLVSACVLCVLYLLLFKRSPDESSEPPMRESFAVSPSENESLVTSVKKDAGVPIASISTEQDSIYDRNEPQVVNEKKKTEENPTVTFVATPAGASKGFRREGGQMATLHKDQIVADDTLRQSKATGEELFRKGMTLFEKSQYHECFSPFQQAAEKGHAEAQWMLGRLYLNGWGVSKNYSLAEQWTRKAAEQGVAQAECNLGRMYANGVYLAQDYSLAATWLRKSADHGNAEAQVYLGELYYRGRGVPQDYVLAASWFRKAAVQGSAEAQFDLGVCYERGEGVPKDSSAAAAWYRKAAAQGHEKAKKALSELEHVPIYKRPISDFIPDY